jgi:hypothetical protein
MRIETFTIICAWCHCVVKTAATDALVSHTICPTCLEWTLTNSASDADRGPYLAKNHVSVPDGYFGNVFKP